MSTARYINPYTDFGFKKLFGEEGSKLLLIDFLNELLLDKHKIKDLSFKNTDQLPDIKTERKAVYDIYCETKEGIKFIVEMQAPLKSPLQGGIKGGQDRAVFYTTFPIREQADKGDWNFELQPVYCVAILDFEFEKGKEDKNCVSNIQLKNQYCEVFFDKLTFIFIEMPRFTKTEKELKTHFDKWLYFLKNLETFADIPEILKEEVFIEGFKKAEIANYNQKERDQYEESLKIYRDLKAVIETAVNEAHDKGKAEGIEIGVKKGKAEGIEIGVEKGEQKKAEEIAISMIQEGLSNELICKMTGLSYTIVETLRKDRKKEL